MQTLKIIKTSETNFLVFHGKSLCLLSATKDTSPEIFNLIEEKKNEFKIPYDKAFQEFLDNIATNNVANTESALSPKLDTLVLPISSGCNLICPYCFAKTKKGSANYKDFTERDVDALLALLHEKNKDIPTTIVFFGGEPLMNFKIIEYTISQVKTKYSDLDIKYSITTNGTLINNQTATFLKENKIAILLSLDGFDNEFNYRKFRNGKSSVPRVLKSINLLKEMEVPFEIRATITSDNPFVYETYMFFEELAVPFVIAFAYNSENPTHKELSSYNSESLKHMRNAFCKLTDYYKNCVAISKPMYNKLIWQYHEILKNRTVREFSCAAGRTYHTVLSDGTMFSCAHLMNEEKCKIGNLREWPLKDIERYGFIPVRISTIEECRDCWAQQLCHGGCASQKYSMGKTARQSYLPEKCELDKIMYEFLIKIYYELNQIS